MNIYYDFEFLESGPASPILPISLGMIRDDGTEFYAITDNRDTITMAAAHPWLRGNVLPYLPIGFSSSGKWSWDKHHKDYRHVMSRDDIADRVYIMIRELPEPRLWGWYSAYDHVVLAQLFGRMIDLPQGVPMWTNDLKQEAGNIKLPSMPGRQEHHALEDAREIRWRYHYYRHNFCVHNICPCGVTCNVL